VIHKVLKLSCRFANLAFLGQHAANNHHLAAPVVIDVVRWQITVVTPLADAVQFGGILARPKAQHMETEFGLWSNHRFKRLQIPLIKAVLSQDICFSMAFHFIPAQRNS